MKKFFLALQLTLALLFLQACASGPTFREYAASVPKPKPGNSRVWFYRPTKMGAALQPAVYLNGEKVGKAQPGGFFYADRPPGLYEAKCTTEWTHKCQFSLAPNSEKFIRLNLTIGLFAGHVIPREVSESEARADLMDLRLNDPN